MANYNRVIMVGNLTRDPEYKQLSSGQSVCRLGIASNRQFRNRQTGEMNQEVCFVDVDVWGQQAESCGQYLQKGRTILVEGRLKLDVWQDNEGQRRSKHYIVADRVIFMSSQQAEFAQQDDSILQAEDERGGAVRQEPGMFGAEKKVKAATKTQNLGEEQGLKKEIRAKSKDNVAKSEQDEQSSIGEIDFKDKEPFEDDLPF